MARIFRRDFLAGAGAVAFADLTPGVSAQVDELFSLDDILASAETLEPLKAVAVSCRGQVLAARGYNGHTVREAANIKSASKSVITALVGIAIDRDLLEGPNQRIAPILRSRLPSYGDYRLHDITIGHLMSMRAGLGSTSGGNYANWVANDDWVAAALARPFADDPGGRMIYSTGSSHLLSAILTEITGRSTLALARDWLSDLEDFEILAWERDHQGIYLGGNQMAMSALSLLSFGELYRRSGLAADGTRIISSDWIEQSWQRRTRSRWTGDGYGYGWFLRRIGGLEVRYGWGYGGQMIYVVPSLELTVAITSDETRPSAAGGYRNDLHRLFNDIMTSTEVEERQT